LSQETDDFASGLDGAIESDVGTLDVSAQVNEIFGLTIYGQGLANTPRAFRFIRARQFRLQTAYGVEDLDCGVMSGCAKMARERDVPIEDRTDGVANGLIKIVALDKDGKEASDRPVFKIAGPLTDPGQETENGRRVALLTRWLAGCQTNLALSHRQPCNRVHDEEYIFPSVTKVFGHRQSDKTGSDTQGGGAIGSGDNYDRAFHPFFAEVVFKKLADLTVAFGEIHEAGDGTEAVDILKTRTFGLVLSDINMPQMDGLQLLARIKEMESMKNVPVIMITTEGGQGRVMEAVQLGAAGYVRKPFTADQIKEKLAGIV
jgi:two-component system chemotaxis response regulator CheY